MVSNLTFLFEFIDNIFLQVTTIVSQLPNHNKQSLFGFGIVCSTTNIERLITEINNAHIMES